MIKSMTAFAREHSQNELGNISIEFKTVNSRYLDLNIRLPDLLREMEMPLRELIRSHIQRGKVDFTLRYIPGEDIKQEITLNTPLVKQLITTAESLSKELKNPAPIDVMDILRWQGVISVTDIDITPLHKAINTLMLHGLNTLNKTREREGAALTTCLTERLIELEKHIQIIEPFAKKIVEQQRQKLLDKIAELNVSVDPSRLEQEIVFACQKLDIMEEVDRLKTHVKETRRVLKEGGAAGRRLDFLMQEFNREANTIASKANLPNIISTSVEMKVLIEQMREQIQNIE
jgi:uncharacterized protein (TIGR00255 family)